MIEEPLDEPLESQCRFCKRSFSDCIC